MGVGYGNDTVFGLLFAHLGFELLFEQTEGDGGLGGRSRLGDDDDTERFPFQEGLQFKEVILTDVLSGKENHGVLMFVAKELEGVGKGFDYGFGSQIAAADTDYHHDFAAVSQLFGSGFEVGQMSFADFGGQMQPPQKVITLAGTFVQHFDTVVGFAFESENVALRYGA